MKLRFWSTVINLKLFPHFFFPFVVYCDVCWLLWLVSGYLCAARSVIPIWICKLFQGGSLIQEIHPLILAPRFCLFVFVFLTCQVFFRWNDLTQTQGIGKWFKIINTSTTSTNSIHLFSYLFAWWLYLNVQTLLSGVGLITLLALQETKHPFQPLPLLC